MTRPNPILLWDEVVLPALVDLGPEAVYQGVELRHHQGRQWRGACPWHGGSSTTSFVVDSETLRWQCFGGCGGGSPLAYLAGGDTPRGRAFVDAVHHYASLAGVPWPDDEDAARALPRRPVAPRTASVLRYPPEPEVLALWSLGRPVDEDPDATVWFEGRRIDAAMVAARDLARALPRSAPCPTWARFWGPWSHGPYRLLVPLWDAGARLRSLHARALAPVEPGRPKAVSTASLSRSDTDGTRTTCRGLVMADQLARQVLCEGTPPDWWPLGRPLRLLVCEGEPDWLTWATRWSDGDEAAPAVLGIIGGGRSGSWTEDLGARVPTGSRVIVRTDSDPAGEQYARSITRTLDRCRVLRRRDHDQAA